MIALYVCKLSRLPPSMYASPNAKFSWAGQFIGFVPGEKSPYQYLAMQVTAASDSLDTLGNQQQVKIGSALRRMMMGYLQPQDWIRVMGKVKIDSQTGETQWKAREIVKISSQQANQLAQSIAAQPSSSPAIATSITNTIRPTRILICQKSSCRQRGSQAVGEAIARTLKSNDQSAHIHIQPTGCMKQCEAGPHLVLIPPKQPEQKVATTKYTHVTPSAATKIIETIL